MCGVCTSSPAVPSFVTATKKQKKVAIECEAVNSVITEYGTWRVGRWGAGDSHIILWREGKEEGRMMAKATSNVSHRRDRGCQMQSVSVVVTPPLQHLTLTTSPRPLALTGSSPYLYTWGNIMNDTIYYLREALKIKAVISLDKVCSNVKSVGCFISLFPLPLSCLASFQWCYNVLHIRPWLLPCQLYKFR